ncbi:MAG TPA: glycosyltransferase family 2 protein, partial [Candidatus Atribacteria bacterium]|nr:glycosyltransferase family 2 protein [Candidatus Atribacteria bacterium]
MNKHNLPFVSIIIPCRNEEKFIGRCLDSIIAQDYPKDKLEILVIDGMSEDGTREIIKNFQISNSNFQIKLIDNPKKFTNFAFNIGIKTARGEIIMLMGAHARYERDYISKCVRYLRECNADNVGGIVIALPCKNTIGAKAIALSLSCRFGVGDAYYQTGYSGKPRWVDTVFGGCYKREVFDRAGLFNENLIRSQDMEFNLRLKKSGGKILLVPDIVSYYYPKSNLKDFFIHNFEDGIWAIYPLKFVKVRFKLRHYIPFIFVLSLLGMGVFGIFFPFFFW